MQLFYTPDISGKTYTLNETESKHCIRVLRKNLGDELTLVDGKGGFYKAEISDANPKRCTVEITSAQNEFGKRDGYLHIAIAPTKNIDRLEWFLEKATEMGMDEITPLLCEHSERKVIKLDRLKKVMISAMKQSVKAYLPRLNNLTNFDAFVQNNNGDSNCFIAHCEEGKKQHLINLAQPKSSNIVLIGPEGDFSGKEIELALQNRFQQISLGESRLRTETAGVAACHILNLVNELK